MIIITLISLALTPQILHPKTKTYPVSKIDTTLRLSGTGEHPVWRKACVLDDFIYPWENEHPHPTRFRALHNRDWLYCLFEATDPEVIIFRDRDDKWEVAASSRAEIFFRIDEKLTPYYCLEIDPLGRVLDYRGNFHRKFDRDWSWPPKGLQVKTHRSNVGYTLELAITKTSLARLGLLRNNALQAGLYRAAGLPGKGADPDFKWISWVRPESPSPDFHIPSSFGILELED